MENIRLRIFGADMGGAGEITSKVYPEKESKTVDVIVIGQTVCGHRPQLRQRLVSLVAYSDDVSKVASELITTITKTLRAEIAVFEIHVVEAVTLHHESEVTSIFKIKPMARKEAK